MRIERYVGIAAPLAREWDELADRSQAVPWLRPGWIGAWWRAFGKGQLEVIALRQGNRLVAVGTVRVGRGSLRSPTNWHTPSYGLLGENDGAVSALAFELTRSATRSIHLSFLCSTGADLSASRAAAQELGYRMIERVLLSSPYVPIEGAWEDYAAGLRRHLLKEIRRCRRRLEERGHVTFELTDGWHDLDSLLEEGIGIEGSGWKAEHGTPIASSSPVRQFYFDVAHWAASRGMLRLAFLRLDGRPIAFDFNIEDAGVCYVLKGGYDPAYRTLGIGTILTHDMLRYAFSKRLSSYEFLGADDSFKMAWTGARRDRVRLQAFAPSLTGRIEYAAFAYGRPLFKRMSARLLDRNARTVQPPSPGHHVE
jgi:CelD/BcsL family acetyltransferase involved in cellulose biosynthesis